MRSIVIIFLAGASVLVGTYAYVRVRDAGAPVVAVPAQSATSTLLENFLKQSAGEIGDTEESAPLRETTEAPLARAEAAEEDLCVKNSFPDFSCMEKHYRALANQRGIPAAFADLRLRYAESSYVRSQCHPLTHVIGQAAVSLYSSAGEAYAHGDSFCWSGYYHGVLEGVAKNMGKETFVRGLNDICANIPGKERYSFDYYNCVHGLGHGLMGITQTEVFDSLAFCDALTGAWDRESCYGGVFMENVMVDNRSHVTKYLKPEDPLYPCNAVGEGYKNACFLMQTSYMLKVMAGNFARVFEECSRVPDPHRATCYQSLGRDASGQSVSNKEATRRTCELGKNHEEKANCIIGAVKDFISYFHSDVEAKELCASLHEDLKSVCYATAQVYYQSFE